MQSNLNGGLNMINLESFITCLKCTCLEGFFKENKLGQYGKNIGNSIEDFW